MMCDRQQRGAVNNVERKSALSFHALAKEDVGSEAIEPSDIASFVNVVLEADLSLSLSRDNIATALYEKTNPEVDHKGARIVWVEHAKTGELVPVILRGGMTVTEDSDDSPEDHKKESDSPNTPLLMPPSLSGKEGKLLINNVGLFGEITLLTSAPFFNELIVTSIWFSPVGDMEGGYAFSTHLQNVNQSTHAYTDTIALLRFAFLFVQGLDFLELLNILDATTSCVICVPQSPNRN